LVSEPCIPDQHPTKTATEFPSSQFREGLFTQCSPLFDGSNYNYWKYRMKIFLQSLNYELWNIEEAPYTKPTTNYNAWNEEQKKSTNIDAKAMNAFFCALNKEEFNPVSTARSANQIWQILQVTHEGKNKVKESKIFILIHMFELFKMKENEIILEMITRFMDIINFLVALGKEYTQVEKIRKVLCALTPDWEKMTTTIEEANVLSTMSLENLIGNLMAYEV